MNRSHFDEAVRIMGIWTEDEPMGTVTMLAMTPDGQLHSRQDRYPLLHDAQHQAARWVQHARTKGALAWTRVAGGRG